MEHEGHYVTGMNNQIVWGLPHIFAVTLIVIASGVLNIASMSSAFNKKLYKPLAFFIRIYLLMSFFNSRTNNSGIRSRET